MLQSLLLRAVDRDTLGFLLFRYHSQQVDTQQTVAQAGELDLDVVRQTEGQFEGTLRNALIQICLLYTSPSPRDS